MNAHASIGNQMAPSAACPSAASGRRAGGGERLAHLARWRESDDRRDRSLLVEVEPCERLRDELERTVEREAHQPDHHLPRSRVSIGEQAEQVDRRPRDEQQGREEDRRRATSPGTTADGSSTAPTNSPIPSRLVAMPGWTECRRGQQSDGELSVGERLGGDHARVDGLARAGDHADRDHGDDERDGEDDQSRTRVVDACGRRPRRSRSPTSPTSTDATSPTITATRCAPPWRIAPRSSRQRSRANSDDHLAGAERGRRRSGAVVGVVIRASRGRRCGRARRRRRR